MGYRHRRPFLIGVLCFALLSSTFASAQGVGNAFDRGYREGIQQGEEDGRDGRAPQAERNSVYRDGNRGYQNRYGSRDVYRDEFRRGFISGYQDGYGRYRGNGNSRRVYNGQRDNRRDPRVLRGYQDPAFARGYSDGWDHGAEDRRDRDRYDPVRHGDYRDGDDGYSRSYGSRDAYKNNYRAGFRQGYEEGYRNGTRYRG